MAGAYFSLLRSHIWHHPRRRIYFLVSLLLLLGYALCLPKRLFDAPFSTVIEDQTGRLLAARIAADGQWRFPEPDSLPEKYVLALVAFEDQRFFLSSRLRPSGFWPGSTTESAQPQGRKRGQYAKYAGHPPVEEGQIKEYL